MRAIPFSLLVFAFLVGATPAELPADDSQTPAQRIGTLLKQADILEAHGSRDAARKLREMADRLAPAAKRAEKLDKAAKAKLEGQLKQLESQVDKFQVEKVPAGLKEFPEPKHVEPPKHSDRKSLPESGEHGHPPADRHPPQPGTGKRVAPLHHPPQAGPGDRQRDELHGRLEHLKQAIEHLRHLGLNEHVRHLEQQAEATERALRDLERRPQEAGHPAIPELMEQLHRLQGEVGDLRHAVGELRREVSELQRRPLETSGGPPPGFRGRPPLPRPDLDGSRLERQPERLLPSPRREPGRPQESDRQENDAARFDEPREQAF